jgi:hypothetical protein
MVKPNIENSAIEIMVKSNVEKRCYGKCSLICQLHCYGKPKY